MSEVPWRALALGVAHTPGAALVRTPTRGWLALGCESVLRVEATECDVAVARFAEVIDKQREEFALSGGVGDRERVVLVGWLSYDACRAGHDPRGVIDGRRGGDSAPCAWLGAPRGGVYSLNEELCESVQKWLKRWSDREVERKVLSWRSEVGERRHGEMVREVRERIAEGEVYLVNVARVLHAEVEKGSVGGVLATRWLAAEAVRGAIVHAGDVCVAAMSMELALGFDRATGLAVSKPIKGTRRRRENREEDCLEAERLKSDPKERAENAMAVDVHRNDLGRVAERGGVTVRSLFEVESHRYVHHLCSRVEARVLKGVPTGEILRSVLPVGSVTGAPKIAAMDVIAEVEPERRGIYTGVYGVVFADGSFELSVAIRTLVADGTGLHYGVGGGIVWDSEVEREWEEVLLKQRGIE